MAKDIAKELAGIIREFNSCLEQQLPALEQEINAMITKKAKCQAAIGLSKRLLNFV